MTLTSGWLPGACRRHEFLSASGRHHECVQTREGNPRQADRHGISRVQFRSVRRLRLLRSGPPPVRAEASLEDADTPSGAAPEADRFAAQVEELTRQVRVAEHWRQAAERRSGELASRLNNQLGIEFLRRWEVPGGFVDLPQPPPPLDPEHEVLTGRLLEAAAVEGVLTAWRRGEEGYLVTLWDSDPGRSSLRERVARRRRLRPR